MNGKSFGELAEFVEDAYSHNMGVTMRINSPATKDLPGGLITVNLTEESIAQLRKPGQVNLTTVEGDTILLPNDPSTVELFLRKPSPEAYVNGFKDVSGPVATRLGGGYRISLEKLVPLDDSDNAFSLRLKTAYSFGDSSPRKIFRGLTGELLYELPIVKGGMILPDQIIKDSKERREEIAEAIRKGTPIGVERITRYMTDRFFTDHYHSALRALLLSYAQFPQPNIAQLEGKWGIQPAFPENNITPLIVTTDLEGIWTVAGVLRNRNENPFYAAGEEMRTNFLAFKEDTLRQVLPMRTADELANAAHRAYQRHLQVKFGD